MLRDQKCRETNEEPQSLGGFFLRTIPKMEPDVWDPYINLYPLVNIQKAIENGHRNSGFIH